MNFEEVFCKLESAKMMLNNQFPSDTSLTLSLFFLVKHDQFSH